MSYDLYVGEGPFPLDDAKAWDNIRARLDEFVPQDGSPGVRRLPAPSMRAFHDDIIAALPEWKEGELEPVEIVWASGPLINEFSGDIAFIPMTYPAVDKGYPVVLRAARKHGLIVFDASTDRIYRNDANAGVTMQVDGFAKAYWPSDNDVATGLERLRLDNSPGFLILERSDGSYTQALGGPAGYMAEWRQHDGEAFIHWVVGRAGESSEGQLKVRGNGGVQMVLANEKLKKSEVLAILLAFTAGKKSPEGFILRDISEQFPVAPPANPKRQGFLNQLRTLFGGKA